MFRNYLIVAFRNLSKNKTTSIINILGLASGFATCLLIGLYIQHELSYDQYHQNKNQIYRLVTKVDDATYENGIAKVSALWGVSAKEIIPEIESYTRFRRFGEALIQKNNSQFYERNGFFADSSTLGIFTWKVIKGNAATALIAPNSIVLTASLAEKYFPGMNPIGQMLNVDNQPVYKVTAVVDDPPATSHFNFSFLISMSTYKGEDHNSWLQSQYYTYLLLKEGASPENVSKKISSVLHANMDKKDAQAYTPFLQPLTDIHLHSNLFREIEPNADNDTITIFTVIALVILFVALLNFINLTTAKSANRAKEVGVRKANGAVQYSLVTQFLLESIIVGIIAGAVAYLLANLLMVPFSEMMERKVSMDVFSNIPVVLSFLAFILLSSAAAGIYPAFILSSFKPIRVLKGDVSFRTNTAFRKGLLVFQYTLSIALICTVLIIGIQMRFIRQKDLGFSKEQVITVPVQGISTIQAVESAKQQFASITGVTSISSSSNQPGGNDWGLPYEAVGLPKDQHPAMRCLVVDEDFFKTYDIKIKEGRAFSKSFSLDSAAFMINETAARQLGWKNPIGQQLAIPVIGKTAGPIIGVVKDFHYHSLHEKIEPLYFFMNREMFSQFNIRIDPANTSSVLADLKTKWNKIVPQIPFRYTFLDENFEAFYQSENKISKLLIWFTIMAIIISSLGLYALSALVARQRIREIGIRKILGASVPGIVLLLSKEFCILVLLATVIASPLAGYVMHNWLQNFAYRTDLNWWIFVLAGLIALIIALTTVGYQAVKAALANPVKNLRSE